MTQIKLPVYILKKWQRICDMIATFYEVPTALITQAHEKTLEILISSNSEGNQVKQGVHLSLDATLYCKEAMSSRNYFLMENAANHPLWKDAPEAVCGLVSYLGFPLILPDGKAFGTLCILDDKENAYSKTLIELFSYFRELIEIDLNTHFISIKKQELHNQIHEVEIQESKDETFREMKGAIHHHLNQPLSVIVGSASLLKKQISSAENHEKLIKHINHIESACKKITTMLNKLDEIDHYENETYNNKTKIARIS